MAYVDSNYVFVGDKGSGYQRMWHRFYWSESRSGNTTTVTYKVVVTADKNTQAVNQNCRLYISANGAVKVNYAESIRTNWKAKQGYDEFVLLSGSFTVAHNTSNGTASFYLSLESAIYYKAYGAAFTHTCNLTTISLAAPSITSIKDNGNNTISIATSAGTNLNGKPYLYVNDGTSVGTGNYDKYIERTAGTHNFNLSDLGVTKTGIKSQSTVAAFITQKNGDSVFNSSTKTATVYYYNQPDYPGKPTAVSNNQRGDFTPTSKATFTWTKPASGCDGYRIRIFKKSPGGSYATVNIPGSVYKDGNYYLDRAGGTNTTFTFDLSGCLPDDKIYIGIYSYVSRGDGVPLWNGGGVTAARVDGDEILIVPDNNYKLYVRRNDTYNDYRSFKKAKRVHRRNSNNAFKEVINIYDFR